MMVNPSTGEELRVVSADPGLLVLETRWTRPGHRATAHLHPSQEERFVVLEGAAAIRVGGEEHHLAAGESFAVAPGEPHLAWNPTKKVVRLRLEFRPALRWLEFVERLFALAPGDRAGLAALGREYDDVVQPARVD